MRFFHYSRRTEEAYWGWIVRFLKFHRRAGPARSHGIPASQGGERQGGWRHPREMGPGEVAEFLSHLANERDVSAWTQNQALNGLVLLYGVVLRQPLGNLGEWARAKRPARLPAVLTREETGRVLAVVSAEYRLPARLLYGSGLRLIEMVRRRVKDLDLERRQILVRDGKGFKDRVTMVPEALVSELREQLVRARVVYEADRRQNLPGVWLPDALAGKYPRARPECAWFWVFPARGLSRDPETGAVRRHHLLEDNVQRAVKLAALGVFFQVSRAVLRVRRTAGLELGSRR
jgi:integrase